MRFKDVKEFFARTAFATSHPNLWNQTYRYDCFVDRFILLLLNNRKDVEFLAQSSFWLCLKYKDEVFMFWRCNRWYAYISKCKDIKGNELWKGKRPSRLNMWRFYKAFDNDFKGFEYFENLASYIRVLERPKDAADTF